MLLLIVGTATGAAAQAGSAMTPLPPNADGHAIYRAACATCHGVFGDGRGPDSAGLVFPATNFRRGVYKLRSTNFELLPTREDLVRSIRDGVSGSEMVPFGTVLTAESIDRVAAYLMTFSPRFRDPQEALKPGDSIAIPAQRPFPRSAASVAAGREIYEREECDSCHGANGDGEGPDAAGMTDDWDRPIFMLDWRTGVFKSGTSDQDVYRSIATGMNGTPMVGYAEDISDTERWQLVDFIRSLEASRGILHFLFGDEPSGLNYR